MQTLNYSTLIQESVAQLVELERKQTQARFRDYIRFLRYLKAGQAPSQQASGALIGLKTRQSQSLWRTYRQHGLNYLLSERRGGSVGYLSYGQISQMQGMLRQSRTGLTQEQIADWIASNFGKRFSQSGISVLFKRLKIKLKTGRPTNVRKEEAAALAFKKTLPRP